MRKTYPLNWYPNKNHSLCATAGGHKSTIFFNFVRLSSKRHFMVWICVQMRSKYSRFPINKHVHDIWQTEGQHIQQQHLRSNQKVWCWFSNRERYKLGSFCMMSVCAKDHCDTPRAKWLICITDLLYLSIVNTCNWQNVFDFLVFGMYCEW